jgi:hypothetical protein
MARGCAEIGANLALLDVIEPDAAELGLLESQLGAKVQYYKYVSECRLPVPSMCLFARPWVVSSIASSGLT